MTSAVTYCAQLASASDHKHMLHHNGDFYEVEEHPNFQIEDVILVLIGLWDPIGLQNNEHEC